MSLPKKQKWTHCQGGGDEGSDGFKVWNLQKQATVYIYV